MDGRELSSVAESDPDLCSIPVVVFTTSNAPADIAASYSRHANAYVTKPLDLDALERAVDKVHAFYGETARRPS
jgi:CheY-like chemotaxis protein